MRDIRFSLIQLLVFVGLALNIERLDFGTRENIVNLASFVYVLTGVAVFLTILIPNKWMLSTRSIVIFWVAVYLSIKIASLSSRPIFGGLYTYISIVEVVVLAGSIIFVRKVLEKIQGLEETVANITMVDVSSRVKNLDEANDDIRMELVRSRRYSRPLGLIVVHVEADTLKANIDNLSEDMLRMMMSSYTMRNLVRAIDKEIRRPDLILEQFKENRIILLLPETDSKSIKTVAENVKKIATNKIGSPIAIGSAVFPEDAITFDDLVGQAENMIDENMKEILFDTRSVDK